MTWWRDLSNALIFSFEGAAELAALSQEVHDLTQRVLQLEHPQPQLTFRFGPSRKKGAFMSAGVLYNDEMGDLPVTGIDVAGNPVPIDKIITATSSDETIATVAISTDMKKAMLTTVDGAVGNTVISMEVDVHLGGTVQTLSGGFDLAVLDAATQATGLTATLENVAKKP